MRGDGPQGPFATASNMALLSALLFCTGSIFQVVAANIEHDNPWNSHEEVVRPFTQPLPSQGPEQSEEEQKAELVHRNSALALAHRWDARANAKSSYMTGTWLYAGGWYSALPAVDCLARALGGGSHSSSSMLRGSFQVAALLTIIEFTSEAGTSQMANWITTWPAIKGDPCIHPPASGALAEQCSAINTFGPLQTLELAYQLVHSRTLWLFALDRICLLVALSATAYMIYAEKAGTRSVSILFAHLSVLVAIICIAAFFIEIGRYVDFKDAAAGLVFSHVAVDMILLPAWLLFLSCQLRTSSAIAWAANNIAYSGAQGRERDMSSSSSTWQPEGQTEMASASRTPNGAALERARAANARDTPGSHDEVVIHADSTEGMSV